MVLALSELPLISRVKEWPPSNRCDLSSDRFCCLLGLFPRWRLLSLRLPGGGPRQNDATQNQCTGERGAEEQFSYHRHTPPCVLVLETSKRPAVRVSRLRISATRMETKPFAPPRALVVTWIAWGICSQRSFFRTRRCLFSKGNDVDNATGRPCIPFICAACLNA